MYNDWFRSWWSEKNIKNSQTKNLATALIPVFQPLNIASIYKFDLVLCMEDGVNVVDSLIAWKTATTLYAIGHHIMNVLGLFQSQEINPTGVISVIAVNVNNENIIGVRTGI